MQQIYLYPRLIILQLTTVYFIKFFLIKRLNTFFPPPPLCGHVILLYWPARSMEKSRMGQDPPVLASWRHRGISAPPASPHRSGPVSIGGLCDRTSVVWEKVFNFFIKKKTITLLIADYLEGIHVKSQSDFTNTLTHSLPALFTKWMNSWSSACQNVLTGIVLASA